jgi:hypothetical protein
VLSTDGIRTLVDVVINHHQFHMSGFGFWNYFMSWNGPNNIGSSKKGLYHD